mgnify:CR=1 FL=1
MPKEYKKLTLEYVVNNLVSYGFTKEHAENVVLQDNFYRAVRELRACGYYISLTQAIHIIKDVYELYGMNVNEACDTWNSLYGSW